MKIAHMSDLHFGYKTFNLKQFLSKQWIGNLNLILFRHMYQTEHLNPLPELFEKLGIEAMFFTGDFSSTSLETEFSAAANLIGRFHKTTYCLPGNHDCYTKESEERKLFYQFFPSEELKKTRITASPLKEEWWWIGLDCALATPPFCSYGRFFNEMGDALQKTLSKIPKHAKIVMGNHFPLIATGRPRHDLGGSSVLQDILKQDRRVKLYLHGHDHTAYIIDKQKEGLPLIMNCGSCARNTKGTFNLMTLQDQDCFVEKYRYSKTGWFPIWQQTFEWSPTD